MAAIPRHEIELYLNSVLAATHLAEAGNAGAGLQDLSHALERARGAAAGEPWGPELVAKYEGALDRFILEFGEVLPR